MNFTVTKVLNGFIITVTDNTRPANRNGIRPPPSQLVAKDEKDLIDILTKLISKISKSKPSAKGDDSDAGYALGF